MRVDVGTYEPGEPAPSPLPVQRFSEVRRLTEDLCSPLSDADASGQSMPDASPAKWHLAHTTWFFETFVLQPSVAGYSLFDGRFGFLFNSYYEQQGPRLARGSRGVLARPSLDQILAYRHHVDRAVSAALESLPAEAARLVELGCQHEQQHQELLLTDILNFFAQSPLEPAVWTTSSRAQGRSTSALQWIERPAGLVNIGATGDDFFFDCEGPRHPVWITPHAMADRLITNAEWLAFIEDAGYRRHELWLSDGWNWVQANAVQAPLYWRRVGNAWAASFGLDGVGPLDPSAPVCHVSYYEADAFARWAGARLPTEFEWEAAASAAHAQQGTLLQVAGPVRPQAAAEGAGLRQMFGDAWEWTGSAYLPYPGFRPAAGAVGEYNGKFMSGQFVLRGGSCATPRGHVRATYRNFFYPHQRWQFTGVRLARDL